MERRKSLGDSFSFPAARYRPSDQFARLEGAPG